MSRHLAARPIAVGFFAATVLIAGCSSHKATTNSASTTPTSATTTSAPAASSPAASSPSTESSAPAVTGDPQAVKLYNEAIKALQGVTSVHLKGSGTDSGETIGVDLSFDKNNGATGSLTVNGGTMNIVATKDAVYIQADAKSYAAFGGGSVPPDALAAIAGKWLKISTTDSSAASAFGDLSAFTNLKSFTEAFAPSGKLSLVPGKKTINGKTAVGLLDTGDNGGILYVEDGGDHLPLAVAPGGTASASATGEIDFIDYNKPVTVTAPAGALDISQLMAAMASPSAS